MKIYDLEVYENEDSNIVLLQANNSKGKLVPFDEIILAKEQLDIVIKELEKLKD